MNKKRLRVYYKSSLLSNYKYFTVETPEEGKRLMDALQATTGDIIKENDLVSTASLGTFSIGLEEFDTVDNQWYEWIHPELGCFVEEVKA